MAVMTVKLFEGMVEVASYGVDSDEWRHNKQVLLDEIENDLNIFLED